MDSSKFFGEKFDKKNEIVDQFYIYLSFWPFFLISFVFSLFTCFLILRYTDDVYRSSAKIEIIDDAMDSEMALPTEMTIFNRSTINLENEIGVLRSFALHSKVIRDLKFNVEYYEDFGKK